MPGPRITDAQRARILVLAQAGYTRNAIGRELGISAVTAAKYARLAGFTFDRTATAAATAAKQADNKARRALISSRLLDEAESFLNDLHKPHVAFNFGGKDNDYNEHLFDKPPQDARLKLMQSVNIALGRHIDLDRIDSDSGISETKSLLADLGKALGIPQAGA